jgi:hypothetical protein
LAADLYQQPKRDSLHRDFKQYVLARIHYFQVGNCLPSLYQVDKEARYYSSGIWNRASTSVINAKTLFPGNLMLPSLNEMIDSAKLKISRKISST